MDCVDLLIPSIAPSPVVIRITTIARVIIISIKVKPLVVFILFSWVPHQQGMVADLWDSVQQQSMQ